MSEQKLWSVTTLISTALGTSKPLVEWNVRTVAEHAYDKHKTLTAFVEDDDRDGAIKWLKDARWKKTGSAAARGTDIHRAAEMLNLGMEPAEVADDPVTMPYIAQYRRFLEDFGPEFIMAEAPVYSKTYGYAGTLDAIAKIDGQTVVLDMKTTAHGPHSGKSRPPFPEVALQLTMYRHAELVGILADRREINYRRYYVLDEEVMHLEPMPEVRGGICLVISPEDYMLVPVDTSERVWKACLHVLNVAKFQVETSKDVFGPPIAPKAVAT